jgi:hypothetical protein
VVQSLRCTCVYLNCNYFHIGSPASYDRTAEPLPTGSHLSSPHSHPSFPSRFPLPLLPSSRLPLGRTLSLPQRSLQLHPCPRLQQRMRSLINDHVMLPRGVGMSTRGGNTCPSCRPPAWQRETQHISSALTPHPPLSSRSRRPGDGEETWDWTYRIICSPSEDQSSATSRLREASSLSTPAQFSGIQAIYAYAIIALSADSGFQAVH